MAACKLSAERFAQPFLFTEWLKSLPDFPIPLAAGVGLLLVWSWRFRGLWTPWGSIENGNALRIVAGVAAFTIAWPFTTDPINLYFDHERLADRVMTIGLFALIWLRPVFVLPFLIAILPLIAQHNEPFHNFSWTLHFLPIRILVLQVAMFTVALVTGKWKSNTFIFLLLVIVASHYAAPGAAKIKEGWIFTEEFHRLVPVRFATGWRGFLNEGTMPEFANLVAPFDFPIQVVVVILEISGAGILFFRHKSAIPLLVGWTFFHIAVLTLSGICFWQWIMIDGALAVLLWKYPALLTKQPYAKAHSLASAFLIATSIVWLNMVPLYWIDTPLIYTYRIEGDGESGKVYNLPSSCFGPYDFELKLMGFSNLISPEQPALGRVWGGVGLTEEAKAAASVSTPEGALAFEREHGRLNKDRGQFDRARVFFTRWMLNLAERGNSADSTFSFLQAPPALWLSENDNDYRFDEPIRKVRVYHVYSLWDKTQLKKVRESLLIEVDAADRPTDSRP